MTDLNKMIKLLTELNYQFTVDHSKGATTIEMISDNEHRIHFYFDLNLNGGKSRGHNPTVF